MVPPKELSAIRAFPLPSVNSSRLPVLDVSVSVIAKSVSNSPLNVVTVNVAANWNLHS